MIFCRIKMNVERKLQLSLFHESYWDMLPPEIQAYIMQLVIAQRRIDAERKEMMNRLCQEIQYYARVKERWGLGHVQCIPNKEPCSDCHRYHLQVYGILVDGANIKQKMFLGQDMKDAYDSIHFVKSLL